MAEYSAFFSPVLAKNKPIEQEFGWWEELFLYFIPKSDAFCVECYSDSETGLKSCAKMGAQNLAVRIADGRIESWAGPICKPFINELIQDPYCMKRNRVKWDRLFLRAEKRTLVSVALAGGEISLHDLTEEDLAFVVKLLAPYDISVCYWENVCSGNIVPVCESLKETLKTKKRLQKNSLFEDE